MVFMHICMHTVYIRLNFSDLKSIIFFLVKILRFFSFAFWAIQSIPFYLYWSYYHLTVLLPSNYNLVTLVTLFLTFFLILLASNNSHSALKLCKINIYVTHIASPVSLLLISSFCTMISSCIHFITHDRLLKLLLWFYSSPWKTII